MTKNLTHVEKVQRCQYIESWPVIGDQAELELTAASAY